MGVMYCARALSHTVTPLWCKFENAVVGMLTDAPIVHIAVKAF